jgi:hypothetical protein
MSKYEPANQINSLIRSILQATVFDVFAGNKNSMKLYAFFRTIPRRLNFICRSDPPLPFHPPSYWLRLISSQIFSRINTPTFSKLVILHSYPPMRMEQTEWSETSAYKIQTPGNYTEESSQHSERGESLKSRALWSVLTWSATSTLSSQSRFRRHDVSPLSGSPLTLTRITVREDYNP